MRLKHSIAVVGFLLISWEAVAKTRIVCKTPTHIRNSEYHSAVAQINETIAEYEKAGFDVQASIPVLDPTARWSDRQVCVTLAFTKAKQDNTSLTEAKGEEGKQE